jgi:hypothetical protein
MIDFQHVNLTIFTQKKKKSFYDFEDYLMTKMTLGQGNILGLRANNWLFFLFFFFKLFLWGGLLDLLIGV